MRPGGSRDPASCFWRWCGSSVPGFGRARRREARPSQSRHPIAKSVLYRRPHRRRFALYPTRPEASSARGLKCLLVESVPPGSGLNLRFPDEPALVDEERHRGFASAAPGVESFHHPYSSGIGRKIAQPRLEGYGQDDPHCHGFAPVPRGLESVDPSDAQCRLVHGFIFRTDGDPHVLHSSERVHQHLHHGGVRDALLHHARGTVLVPSGLHDFFVVDDHWCGRVAGRPADRGTRGASGHQDTP